MGRSKQEEAARLFAMTETEQIYWQKNMLVAGADEVGRGPLAGPVVTACIVLPASPLIPYVNDSKRVTALRREKLYDELCSAAVAYGFGEASPAEIDEINILQATKRAFVRAYENMNTVCDMLLVDAVKDLQISVPQHAMIHGDAISYLIAAASIIAKVKRDRYMIEMSNIYPEYGFDRNKGYGTKEHIEALRKYGPTPIHRRSFIKNFCGECL